jgi:hypothetical protein
MTEPAADTTDPSHYEQAKRLAAAGVSAGEIKSKLAERGLDAESAGLLARAVTTPEARVEATLADTLETRPGPEPRGGRFRGIPVDLLVGGAILVIGLGVTVGSYATAQSGGTYLVAYGAIFGGALQFLRGLFRLFVGGY